MTLAQFKALNPATARRVAGVSLSPVKGEAYRGSFATAPVKVKS